MTLMNYFFSIFTSYDKKQIFQIQGQGESERESDENLFILLFLLKKTLRGTKKVVEFIISTVSNEYSENCTDEL